MPPVSVLILAAGKGVRMKSARPKVLHRINGVSLVGRVLSSVSALKPGSTGLIVGHGASDVGSAVRAIAPRIHLFRQPVLNGSGGAVRRAAKWIKKQRGDILITCGDAPLITPATFKALVAAHRRNRSAATVLTAEFESPFGYGRIVRGFDGRVEKIVEELDATAEEKTIREINTGTYCFSAAALVRILPKLKADNKKKEYYLTDALEILSKGGNRVGALLVDDASETIGINSREDLAKATQALNRRVLKAHMANGVTVLDPASTYIDETVRIGPDTIVYPQTFIKGNTKIGSRCEIGPWAYIENCKIENDVVFRASFAEEGVVQSSVRVGPYSRIRPGSVLEPGVHLGNFSEVKKSRLGAGSKVNHLSYLGDATLGKNVNIGAGTITCNYDGIRKFPTSVQDHAFVGSNVNLIAPIKIGAHAVVGAGSSLSVDVPSWALAMERAPLRIKKGWARARMPTHKRPEKK